MKLSNYIKCFYIFVFFILTIQLKSQDDFTVIRINNTQYFKNFTEMTFDLEIRRKSETWDRWANGTFQLRFDDPLLDINSKDFKFERIVNEGIKWTNTILAPTPVDGYYSKTEIEPGRFVIGIIGPQEYKYCEVVPSSSYLKIGTFKITSMNGKKLLKSDGSGPVMLDWLTPYNYYQAASYKTPFKIDINQVEEFYNLDDNIELRDPFEKDSIQFLQDKSPDVKFELASFSARYMGLKRILLDWETLTEFNNQGFLFKRIIKPAFNLTSNVQTIEDLDFSKSTYIRSFNDGHLNANQLETKTNLGAIYQYSFDIAGARGTNHCYELSYIHINGDTVKIAETCVFVPNAVITYAQNNPNPFQNQTTVEYTVEDYVNIVAILYDGSGRELKTVLKQDKHPKGTFSFDLVMPDFSMQGLYDLVFYAYPIDDPSVELSRAVVKLQVIR